MPEPSKPEKVEFTCRGQLARPLVRLRVPASRPSRPPSHLSEYRPGSPPTVRMQDMEQEVQITAVEHKRRAGPRVRQNFQHPRLDRP